jgi:hypothetical protein
MAIKYYSNPKTKETFAVLSGTTLDAINKIQKTMDEFGGCMIRHQYLMPAQFKAKVKLAEGDVYDEEKGKQLAKEKLMKKYYKAFDARMDIFRADLIALNSKVFETPPELIEEIA